MPCSKCKNLKIAIEETTFIKFDRAENLTLDEVIIDVSGHCKECKEEFSIYFNTEIIKGDD